MKMISNLVRKILKIFIVEIKNLKNLMSNSTITLIICPMQFIKKKEKREK